MLVHWFIDLYKCVPSGAGVFRYDIGLDVFDIDTPPYDNGEGVTNFIHRDFNKVLLFWGYMNGYKIWIEGYDMHIKLLQTTGATSSAGKQSWVKQLTFTQTFIFGWVSRKSALVF